MRIFNRSYAEKNLRFDEDNGPNPDSLLTLGGMNVANEAELVEKQTRRDAARLERVSVEKECTVTARQPENTLANTAKTIVDELSRSGVAKYRATNVYNKTSVRSVVGHSE